MADEDTVLEEAMDNLNQRCSDHHFELGPVRVGRMGDVPLGQGQSPGVLPGRAHRVLLSVLLVLLVSGLAVAQLL